MHLFSKSQGGRFGAFMEDAARTHTLDLLEMDYYRNLIEDHRFEHHLEQTNKVKHKHFQLQRRISDT